MRNRNSAEGATACLSPAREPSNDAIFCMSMPIAKSGIVLDGRLAASTFAVTSSCGNSTVSVPFASVATPSTPALIASMSLIPGTASMSIVLP